MTVTGGVIHASGGGLGTVLDVLEWQRCVGCWWGLQEGRDD